MKLWRLTLMTALLAAIALPVWAEQKVEFEDTEIDGTISLDQAVYSQSAEELPMIPVEWDPYTVPPFEEMKDLLRNFTLDVRMKVANGFDVSLKSKLIKPFVPVWVRGDISGISYLEIPQANYVGGGKVRGQLLRGKITYWPMVNDGGPVRMGEPIVFEFFVDYTQRDEHGYPTIRDRFGNLIGPIFGTVAAIRNYYVIREIAQFTTCAAWNFWVGLPFCINSPFFKNAEELKLAAESFGLVYEQQLAGMAKSGGPAPWEGWLEVMVDSYNLAQIDTELEFFCEVPEDGVEPELLHFAHSYIMDFNDNGIGNGVDNDPYNTSVKVPKLIGKTEQVAKKKLEKRGLRVGTIERKPSSRPAGEVIEQSIAKGTKVPKNTAVGITVSTGPQTQYTTVPCPPAGVHWDLEKVKEEVSDANLVLDQIIYENSTTVPAGKLIRFKPPCGTQLPVGSEVDAYMSAGPLKVLIPCPPAPPSYWDVEQSENALNDVGLKLGDVNMTFSNTVPKDKLIFFDPPCGTLVEVGSYVDACISKGPQNPQTTTVPDIVGKQLGAAETTLINALLRLGTAAQQYSTRPIGEVLGQSPTPGQVVAVNSAVNVTVSKGPQGPNPLTVTIDSPVSNFVGVVGQPINFSSTVSGGTTPYSFKWHFPDNSFKYQEDVIKTFDIPGAGWVYLDVTDGNNVTVQKKVWVQINAAP